MRERGLFTIAAFVVISITACSKEKSVSASHADQRDTIPPSVSISSPENDEVFTAGSIVHVEGAATDATSVTEMHIHVSDESKGKLLRDIHAYPLAPTGIIEDSFPAVSGIHYLIKVIAYDAAQNIGVEQVEVQGN